MIFAVPVSQPPPPSPRNSSSDFAIIAFSPKKTATKVTTNVVDSTHLQEQIVCGQCVYCIQYTIYVFLAYFISPIHCFMVALSDAFNGAEIFDHSIASGWPLHFALDYWLTSIFGTYSSLALSHRLPQHANDSMNATTHSCDIYSSYTY